MVLKAGPRKLETRHNARYRRWLATGGLLTACLFVVFLSFISIDAAFFMGVLVVLAAFFDFNQGKSHNLEQFLQSHLYDINARHESLAKDVLRNSEDIRKMEQEIAKTKIDLKAQGALHGKALLQAETARTGFRLDDIIPAFLRPTNKTRAEETVTEDEDLEDTPMRTPPIVETPPAVANDEIFLDDESLSDMVIRELVHHAVEMSRIDVFIQPIVRLPQRQIKFHEMFARIRAKPGVYLPAKRYMNLASEENVMTAIDNMLLLHGLQTLQKHKELHRVSSFFLNIKPETLKNSAFMRDLLGFLSKHRDMAPSLIFEMRQSDFESLSTGEQKILQGLSTLGCSFSLDNIDTIPEDVKRLQDKKIRFVKISADKLLKASKTDKEFTEMMRQKRKLEANGIGVIVEKIESEAALLELLDFNINYGQGFLFGRPDLQGVYAHTRRVS